MRVAYNSIQLIEFVAGGVKKKKRHEQKTTSRQAPNELVQSTTHVRIYRWMAAATNSSNVLILMHRTFRNTVRIEKPQEYKW